MDLDALMLARIQFGFTISFHILFPAITIGLASYLAVLEGCWLNTGQPVYKQLYHFWIKVFAVNKMLVAFHAWLSPVLTHSTHGCSTRGIAVFALGLRKTRR